MITDDPVAAPADDQPRPAAIWLRSPPAPTGREQALAEQVGQHNGAVVPFWMFARLALLFDEHRAWSSGLDVFWARAKRYVWAAALAAAGSVGTLSLNWLHAHDERVAAVEREAANERAFDVYRAGVARDIARIEAQLDQLRAVLLRLGIATPEPPPRPDPDRPPTSDIPDPFNKFSILTQPRPDLCSISER